MILRILDWFSRARACLISNIYLDFEGLGPLILMILGWFLRAWALDFNGFALIFNGLGFVFQWFYFDFQGPGPWISRISVWFSRARALDFNDFGLIFKGSVLGFWWFRFDFHGSGIGSQGFWFDFRGLGLGFQGFRKQIAFLAKIDSLMSGWILLTQPFQNHIFYMHWKWNTGHPSWNTSDWSACGRLGIIPNENQWLSSWLDPRQG